MLSEWARTAPVADGVPTSSAITPVVPVAMLETKPALPCCAACALLALQLLWGTARCLARNTPVVLERGGMGLGIHRAQHGFVQNRAGGSRGETGTESHRACFLLADAITVYGTAPSEPPLGTENLTGGNASRHGQPTHRAGAGAEAGGVGQGMMGKGEGTWPKVWP